MPGTGGGGMRTTRTGPAEADPTEIDTAAITKLILRNILRIMAPLIAIAPMRSDRCEMNAALQLSSGCGPKFGYRSAHEMWLDGHDRVRRPGGGAVGIG
jgi:hypothetical protein